MGGMTGPVRAAIDGACKGNNSAVPSPGGWAIVYESGMELSGHFAQTTNNQMELWAVREVVGHAPLGSVCVLSTDSQNVIGWLYGWNKTTNQPDPSCRFKRKNPKIRMLCDAIDNLVSSRRITLRFEWVKGHAGQPMNERADKLASSAALEQ